MRAQFCLMKMINNEKKYHTHMKQFLINTIKNETPLDLPSGIGD